MSRMKKKLNPILGQILETKVYGYSLIGHKFTFQPVIQIWSLVSSAKPQITNVKKKFKTELHKSARFVVVTMLIYYTKSFMLP